MLADYSTTLNAGTNESPPAYSQQEGHSQLQLTISCSNLPNTDLMSLTDPYVVVYVYENLDEKPKEIGRTEVIYDNLHPHFTKTLTVDYHFAKSQNIIFMVYDEDVKGAKDSQQDFVGAVQTPLGSLVTLEPGTVWSATLNNNQSYSSLCCAPNSEFCQAASSSSKIAQKLGVGKSTDWGLPTITVIADDMAEEVTDVQFEASGLSGKRFFHQTRPFLEVRSALTDSLILATKVAPLKSKVTWGSLGVSVKRISPEPDFALKLIVKDFRGTSNSIMGEVTIRSADLSENAQFPLVHKGKPAGVIRVNSLKRRISFVDYLSHGGQIALAVSIDFTGSNGDPRKANSLHSLVLPNGCKNSYYQIIQKVGDILEPYDRDRNVPVFGYGARLPDGQTSHAFKVSRSVKGIVPVTKENFALGESNNSEVLQAYETTLKSVHLSGPTLFAPIIRAMGEYVASRPVSTINGPPKHYVLTIYTDGAINDMKDTISAIVKYSNFPFSILIIGIGNANFTAMEELDSDDRLLYDEKTRRTAAYDIVQFVEARKYQHDPVKLAQEVLMELPSHYTKRCRDLNVVLPKH